MGKKIKVLHKTGTFKHIFNSTRFLTFEKCHQKIKQNRNMPIINQIQPLTFFTGFLNKHGNKVMTFMSSLFYAALFRKNSFSTGLHEKDETRGGECRSPQWVITATQTCFAACTLLNWLSDRSRNKLLKDFIQGKRLNFTLGSSLLMIISYQSFNSSLQFLSLRVTLQHKMYFNKE